MKDGMRPLPPVDGDGPQLERDHAKGGFSLQALEQLVSDCQAQPEWRPRADLSHAYYDFKQLSEEKKALIQREMGIEPRQTNLIHGVINGVLGQEAKARSDVKLEADDDEFAEVGEVLSRAMKEAQREANADMAVSNGYAGQVKGGLGWVEVSRATDPLDYPYRVREIHRNEIWYDWRATDLGLDSARWLVRKRWEDLDEAVAVMPEHKDVLDRAVNGWNLLELPEDENSVLYRSYNNERTTRIQRDEWCDTRRKRIKFYEVWYRVPAEVVVIQLSPTRRVQYDSKNPLHREAVARGKVKLSKAITRQMRMALYAGPHRLLDVGTTRRRFPYVPFFAFRDDLDRSPYGLIEGMISPQDEYNERRQMVNWMLRARQLLIDNDAVDTEHNSIEEIAAQIMRPDMVAVLNAHRKNANGIRIGNDLTLQKEQFEVMNDAKSLIQEVPRVYGSQLGDAQVQSGIANSLLIEQGIVAMGELNDNYRFARRLVFDELLSLIAEDHADEQMQVVIGNGQNRRVVVLNTWDEQTGLPKNRVKDAPVKVGLSDVPNSPAFRAQEQQQLSTILQALGSSPAAMAILAPAYIEGSSLANRQAIADDLRRATGVPVAGDKQAQEQQQQQILQQQQQQQAIERAKAEAEIVDARAGAINKQSQAMLNQARVREIQHRVGLEKFDRLHQLASPEPPDEDALIAQSLEEAA